MLWALDRIIEIKENNSIFVESNVNFIEYFDDVVGVTIDSESKTQKILLEFSNSQWKYINSNPIHGSQKIIESKDDTTIVSLEVQINFELKRLIFSFGDDVKVLEPNALIETIKSRANNVLKKYK